MSRVPRRSESRRTPGRSCTGRHVSLATVGFFKRILSGSSDDGRLLPRDTPEVLASFGQSESPAAGGEMGPGLDLGRTVREAVQVDPDRVLDEMVEACDKAGGWAYWGAWDILGTYARDHEKDLRFVHIVDGVIDTMRAKGYGPGDIPMGLTARMIERDRAKAAEAPGAGESEPEPEPAIPALAEGEQRLLKVIDRPDGNQNKIYLIHRRSSDDEDDRFVAVIHCSESDDFSFENEWAWKGGADERAVYIRVAEAHANGRTRSCEYWLDSQVQWYADRVA